jgi:hypothetical protein
VRPELGGDPCRSTSPRFYLTRKLCICTITEQQNSESCTMLIGCGYAARSGCVMRPAARAMPDATSARQHVCGTHQIGVGAAVGIVQIRRVSP